MKNLHLEATTLCSANRAKALDTVARETKGDSSWIPDAMFNHLNIKIMSKNSKNLTDE